MTSRNDTSPQGGNSAIVLTSGPEIVSGLHIVTVRPKDAGTYTCAPSNARNYSVVVHVIKGKKDPTVMETGCLRVSSSYLVT